MKWTEEAETLIKKVPFFVRKKIKKMVEDEARNNGKKVITPEEIRQTQKRYLKKMSDEVQGYQVETCFGYGECPNRILNSDGLVEKIEEKLKKADLRQFLLENVKGGLKHHHEFRVSIAECPNACSQPQIKGIGIIGALEPKVSNEQCTACLACEEVCRENAVKINDNEMPVVDDELCVKCGLCINACPTGTLIGGEKGFRVMLGGKLGRHPRLGMEMKGLYSEDEVLDILEKSLSFYKENSRNGARFAEILGDLKDIEGLSEKSLG